VRRAFPLLLAASLALALVSRADDKDLLKRHTVPGNLIIVFGNSQTTQQPLTGTTSQWDGDGDSPTSKMGAAKRVIQQFVSDKQGLFNIGLSTFSHNPNAGSITLYRKHWLYSPIDVDFPSETWKEPAGTIERWGDKGEGPCTTVSATPCSAVSPAVNLPGGASVTGPFFGVRGTGTAYLTINGAERIAVTLTSGQYGDAYTDGTLLSYVLGTHAMLVQKVYQKKLGAIWIPQILTPHGNPGTAVVRYVPAPTLSYDLFYRTAPDAGKAIGFLNDAQSDVDVNANCSGWEFQSNSAPQPLVKIPRDYKWGASCNAAQSSYPCLKRMLRPQATLVRYDAASGTYSAVDHDNPGYAGSGSKVADGCDASLLGAVDIGLDIAQNQAILITRNGSQAPLKNLLDNILSYVNNPSVDGFSRGRRGDDPNAACRSTGVVLVYDNFNGCQNDSCTYLDNTVLSQFRAINVPVYVIGLGTSAEATSGTGYCIAQKSGAVIPQTGAVGYFPVTTPQALAQALADIAAALTEATKVFATATVSSVQANGDQMAYLATFNPTKSRSIWNGRINGFKVAADGTIATSFKTIDAKDDPRFGVQISVPSNDPATLVWNAGMNLAQTPGTGATVASAVLAPGAALSTSTYLDTSTDTFTSIPTSFYPGRKIVFSLPQGSGTPTALPLAGTAPVPETRHDLVASTGAAWWPALKALLGPQSNPPSVLSPALADSDATDALRFVWGDRDAVMGAGLDNDQKYLGLKLGDVFHSSPAIVGAPGSFFYAQANLNGYQAYLAKYKRRRRVLYAGANDGLLHAFDIGAYDRTPSACKTNADGTAGHCYDLGTGAELFAYAPRAIMQLYKPLKDAKGAQTKRDEWTADGSPSAADVFIDPAHSGTPVSSHREWRTVLVGGMREGSPFEGTSGQSPASSRGSYYALDVTQPDELVGTGSSQTIAGGSLAAPRCLDAAGDATCARDWPGVLWEISDTADADVSGAPGFGYGDMGETWSKPGLGRVKICTGGCGTSGAITVDKYVAIFGGGFDRERKNRRGNWLYVVDVETGTVLMKANGSCGANTAAGCTPTWFGSMPAEPSVLDLDGDGYLDVVYAGDLKGQMWRVDLRDLRYLASAPSGRFDNKIDFAAGSPKPFLLFQAPQSSTLVYPIYYRPSAVFLGGTVGGLPVLGIAFGTGDRDDIIAAVDSTSLGYQQRWYVVVDDRSNVTRTEADLAIIASPTAASLTSSPAKGWALLFENGERVITDVLTVQGYLYVSTFRATFTSQVSDACGNAPLCTQVAGRSRFYIVDVATGNPFPGAATRGTDLTNASFASNPIFYISADRQAHVAYTSDYGTFNLPPVSRKTGFGVKEWRER
jgi:Tfp pilus tip-associated adhesin PilY1